MIKVSVMYPAGEGKTFDMEYYKSKHMEIVDRVMKPERTECDLGADGPYMAIGHLYFASMDAMKAGMGGAGEALADVPNFTNIEPVVQTSEIVG